MSEKPETDDLTALLRAWVREEAGPEGLNDADRAEEAADRGLLRMLRMAEDAPAERLSDQDASDILLRIKARAGAPRGEFFGRFDLWLGFAAVVAGVALGLAALSKQAGSVPPAAHDTEIIKEVSFESVHEGKVVQFHLQLRKAR